MNFMELPWKCDVIQEISIPVLALFLIFFHLSHICAVTAEAPVRLPDSLGKCSMSGSLSVKLSVSITEELERRAQGSY